MAAAQSATTTRIDIRPWLEAKYAALAEHRTQIDPSGSVFALTPRERQRVTPTEDFTLRATSVTKDLQEDDLFAGLRDARRAETSGDG
jgi:mycothiol S-conjugate amidase